MRHGLINPPVEAAACKRMLAQVDQRIERLERDLTSVTLEREAYLEKMGAVREARAILAAQQQIYAKEFEV